MSFSQEKKATASHTERSKTRKLLGNLLVSTSYAKKTFHIYRQLFAFPMANEKVRWEPGHRKEQRELLLGTSPSLLTKEAQEWPRKRLLCSTGENRQQFSYLAVEVTTNSFL